MIKKEIIQLTEEQKKCVQHPLNENLIVEANPVTGKTEVLKNRVKFIVEQIKNSKRQKAILVMAYGTKIAKEIRSKLRTEKLTKKIHERLKNAILEMTKMTEINCEHDHCLQKVKPIILVCTIHSLAYRIFSETLVTHFKEKRKIKIINGKKKDDKSFYFRGRSFLKEGQIIKWKEDNRQFEKQIVFNYLFKKLSQGTKDKLNQATKNLLYKIFRKSIEITEQSNPYRHKTITDYP